MGEVSTKILDDEFQQRQNMLPSAFERFACGLKIVGHSKLSACGLGDVFTSKSTYLPAAFFELYTEEDLEEARQEGSYFEEDFNE